MSRISNKKSVALEAALVMMIFNGELILVVIGFSF